MFDWTFILTPLFVLPVIFLFRFIGCGPEVSDDEPIVGQVPAPPQDREYADRFGVAVWPTTITLDGAGTVADVEGGIAGERDREPLQGKDRDPAARG